MDILTPFLSEQTVRQIGWVLVHFLWQGCAVMALMGLVLKLLAKASSNTRYLTACFGLVLMVSAPIVTFILMSSHDSAEIPPSTSAPMPEFTTIQPAAETENVIIINEQPTSLKQSPMQILTARLEASLPFCVLGWVVGVAALSLWYLGGWKRRCPGASRAGFLALRC